MAGRAQVARRDWIRLVSWSPPDDCSSRVTKKGSNARRNIDLLENSLRSRYQNLSGFKRLPNFP